MFFPGSKAPHDTAFINQVLRNRYPDNEVFPETDSLEVAAVSALLRRIGSGTLITHSGSGLRGWLTGMHSQRVKGIVAFEPGVTVFPPGELPPPNEAATVEVPLADFEKLARIPILVIYGDHLEARASHLDGFANTKAFVQALNRHGGDARVIHLPEIGIYGNSHLMMLERNNVQIANLVSRFLQEKGLDAR